MIVGDVSSLRDTTVTGGTSLVLVDAGSGADTGDPVLLPDMPFLAIKVPGLISITKR